MTNGYPTRHSSCGQTKEEGRSDRCSKPIDGNIRKEHDELEKNPRAERRARQDVEGEGNSGPCGNRKTGGSDPKTGRVAPADSKNDIRDLCPEGCSLKNS